MAVTARWAIPAEDMKLSLRDFAEKYKGRRFFVDGWKNPGMIAGYSDGVLWVTHPTGLDIDNEPVITVLVRGQRAHAASRSSMALYAPSSLGDQDVVKNREAASLVANKIAWDEFLKRGDRMLRYLQGFVMPGETTAGRLERQKICKEFGESLAALGSPGKYVK